MAVFDKASHTPRELNAFAIIVAETTITGDHVQSINWSADILYDDNQTRKIRGNLEQYLTPTQRTQLLALLQLLADKARVEMVG